MLQLYTSTHCPYCKKVTAYMDEHNIPYEECNVASEAVHRETLLRLGGKMQIPFLVDRDNDTHLYESDAILAYVQGLQAV